jgi:hypothetical protein
MKKICLCLIIVFAFSFHSFAQWTTGTGLIYYSSGNVGIGTSTPSVFLHVLGTTEQFRAAYDANNYARFIVGSNGALTITPTGTSVQTTLTGSLITGYSTSNLFIGSAGGATGSAAAQYQFAGSANTYVRTGVSGGNSASLATGYNYSGLNVAGSPFTLGTSINIPFAASAVINPITAITIGSGSSVTNTATLYIDGANAQGTNNYALYSSTGLNYFGGTVGINTSYVPSNFLFAINGNMIATGVTVQVKTNWPDYVFNKNYHLPSLNYLKRYISDNKHLPGFPSANEIKNNGIDLGQINTLLTKKVEELTLYLIDKDSQLKTDESRIKADEDKLKTQDERINKLESEVQALLKKGN